MRIKFSGKVLFKFKAEHLIILFSLFLISDLFLQVIPVWIPFVLIFIIHGIFLNKYENAFLFILFASILAGAFFKSLNISGLGGFFIPIGLALIWRDIYLNRSQLFKHYIPLVLIFILLAFSAYLNSGGDFYQKKLLSTITYGTTSFIAFSILFANRGSVRFARLALIFILWSVFLLRLVIDINNIPGPTGLLHFGFMRDQTNPYDINALVNIEDFTISYHLPGFMALVGLTLFLTEIKGKTKLMNWFIWILTLMVIFYSGARQNILVFIALLIFYIYTLREYSAFRKYVVMIIIGLITAFALFSINSDTIKNVLFAGSLEAAADATGRSVRMGRGVELFNSKPFFGVGFGHYDFMGNYERFPHNMIVEILSELGLSGLFVVSILLIHALIRNWKAVNILHKNNLKPYLIFMPLFIRSMVSGSLTTNIIVVSFIFSLPFFIINNNNSYNEI